jgi:flagellar hook-length control protein FliK
MLNTAPIAAATPQASPMTAPGQTPQGSGGPPFAQALDQAAARQRDTATDAAAPDGAAIGGPGQPRSTPSAGSARLAALRHAVARDRLAPPTETTGKSSPQVAEANDKPVLQDDPRTQQPEGDALLDLAALLSGLTPQRMPAPDSAAPSTPPGNDAERGGKTAALCNEAATQHPASARDLLLPTGADSAKPDATPVAVGLATAPGRDAIGEDKRLAVAFGAAAMLARGAQLGGADSELQAGNEGLHLALGRLRQAIGSEGNDKLPAATAMPLANAWPLAGPRGSDSAPPFQAELKAALGTTEFASNLGSQLSVLVRDGIEHAQLKLNPAEMGPIEVRIRVDGAQAQVDFSAAHAATRQALQDAVPALASALLDNGLTLTGGGVFEQPREPRGDARRDRPDSSMATGTPTREGATSDTRTPRLPRASGVVDLYA